VKSQNKVFEKQVRLAVEIFKRNCAMGIDADTKENRHSISYYNHLSPVVMAEACRRYRKGLKKV
jgi:hypothetical protein